MFHVKEKHFIFLIQLDNSLVLSLARIEIIFVLQWSTTSNILSPSREFSLRDVAKVNSLFS